MPYLDLDYTFSEGGTTIPAGTWVPELKRQDWNSRGASLQLRDAWTRLSGPTLEDVAAFDGLTDGAKRLHWATLGRDMASAQRDGLFYFNALERLKSEPDDTVADEVIEHLKDLGFMSIDLGEEFGGPPPGESPRPFKKVMGWLIQQLAKVGRFLLNAVAFITATIKDLGLSAVALQIGCPVSVSFEFPPDLFRNPPLWRKARELVDNFLTELGEKVFV